MSRLLGPVRRLIATLACLLFDHRLDPQPLADWLANGGIRRAPFPRRQCRRCGRWA